MAKKIQPIEQKFWSHVAKTKTCWLWCGGTRAQGQYGSFLEGGRGSKAIYAHRYSYEIHQGPIPEGLQVMHSCDNPLCVNPKHLSAGTQAENNADKDTKGRHGKTGPKPKLTSEQIQEVRDSVGLSCEKLAKKYGVGHSTIGRIRLGISCQGLG